MSDSEGSEASGATPPPKRRKDSSTSNKNRKDDRLVCIIHVPGLNPDKYGQIKHISTQENADSIMTRLKEIRDRRLGQPQGSAHRMEEICNMIPDEISAHQGYHRECYKRFTMNLNRLTAHSDSPASCSRPSRRSGDSILFSPDCIFCNSTARKKIKLRGSWTTEGLSNFEYGGWQNLENTAEEKGDQKLLTRIRGKDLFACEAKYHRTCKSNYVQNPEKWRSGSIPDREKERRLNEAHRIAFEDVCQTIDRYIIQNKKMMKLSDLRKLYVARLQDTEFPNLNYRSEKLKEKLEKHHRFGGALAYCEMDIAGAHFHGYIVYSADTDMSDAVRNAYKLGSSDMVKESGSYLHEVIKDCFKMSDNLKWPPSAQDLENVTDLIPSDLERFLSYIICRQPVAKTPRTHRLIQSIGQDICRAATNGEWKLPKHVLLCMTLRHMFRSERLITLLNRMGHSENYSFSLELETSIALAVQETSSLLTTQIIRSPESASVFHSEFDNFDQLLNCLTGKESIHTAHGIMLQDIEGHPDDHGGVHVEMPSIDRRSTRKQRSLSTVTQQLPDCYVTLRRSPQMIIHQVLYPGGADAFHDAMLKHMLWIMARQNSVNQQNVPGLTGFLSNAGKLPESLTTIDYYPVIASPITEYKTVQECLRYAENATNEVTQQYTITTFDLGVCMKAYPLIWNNAKKYENHIILLGTFHLSSAFMKMIGKKMRGTGLSDILLEAGLIGSGSLQGVLSGKHYERALHCHKVLVESLERLLLQEYLSCHNEILPEQSQRILGDVTHSQSSDAINAALSDDALHDHMNALLQYRDDCKAGSLGKTCQLWLSYMDHVWLLLALIQAVKHNNFTLYAHCLHEMSSIFFSFGGQNYARYLSFFSVFISNIEYSHPGATALLARGAISVARSFIPGNRSDVDKTMEETFMRHAKSHGGSGTGVSGILTNQEAYQRWVRTTHARSQYVNSTLNTVDMQSSGSACHRDLRPTEIARSEKLIRRTQEAVESFMNPFTVDIKDKLVILSSGQAATAEIEKAVLGADQTGREARDVFVSTRLQENKDFFEPIKRLNLKTLADMNKKVKITTSQNKVVQYKEQGNVAFQLFLRSQKLGIQLQLKELMKFPMTPVPYSIATSDGFFTKTDKSKSFAFIVKTQDDAVEPPSSETLVILDGNAYFYYLKDVPGSFDQICQKVFDVMSKSGDAVFSTDTYVATSVKAMERERRGCGEQLIIKGEKTKKPADWKSFLSNDRNKQQFIELLTRLWSQDSYAKKLQGRQVTVVCAGAAYLLTSADGQTTTKTDLPLLQSSQEETDSRIILYCDYGRSQNYHYIRVKSPDTDVFYILLHYAIKMENVTILFDTGTGNKKRLINITTMAQSFSQEHATALLALHAFSGCDTTSSFKGLGKVKPLKVLLKLAKFEPALARLGNAWDVPDDLMNELDAFTCALYGRPRIRTVDELRYIKMNEMCVTDLQLTSSKNIDMSMMPPCRRSLEQHIRRVNYQVGIWKRSHIPNPDIPLASDGHGWTLANSKLEPLWYNGEVLPIQLADISEEGSAATLADDSGDSEDDISLTDDTDYLDIYGDSDSDD